jgi:hypothetical protein
MKQIFLILLLIPACIYSVNLKKWKKTSSGIYYKIYTNDSTKERPAYGDHIWMHLRKFGLDEKEMFNTRIFDAARGVEMEYKLPDKKGDVTEIFSLMGTGDSAFVMIPANLTDANGSSKKYYSFWLNLVDFKRHDLYLLEKKEMFMQQLILDSLEIKNYFLNNDLHDAVKDESGNWFIRKQNGNGAPVKNGDSVIVHYIGKLTNNRQFDNSYDRKQTFGFVVGKKQVIDGLDKGIQDFFYGDSGLLIIPSRLGYGDKEVGKIPPNSVLIFELEILPR